MHHGIDPASRVHYELDVIDQRFITIAGDNFDHAFEIYEHMIYALAAYEVEHARIDARTPRFVLPISQLHDQVRSLRAKRHVEIDVPVTKQGKAIGQVVGGALGLAAAFASGGRSSKALGNSAKLGAAVGQLVGPSLGQVTVRQSVQITYLPEPAAREALITLRDLANSYLAEVMKTIKTVCGDRPSPDNHATIVLPVKPGSLSPAIQVDSAAALERALTTSAPASTIQLAPGVYKFPKMLAIAQSIRLLGSGADNTNVFGEGMEGVLTFTGNGFLEVEGISFVHSGQLPSDVVSIAGGNVIMTDCVFSGGRELGCGLVAAGNVQAMIRDCRAEYNDNCGFIAVDNAEMRLERSVCRANQSAGIGYFGRSKGIAYGNVCISNAQYGMRVGGQAQPILIGNICRENGQHGIEYSAQSNGQARGNLCMENGLHGIALNEQAQPRLLDNICRDNQQSGIAYFGNTGGQACGNSCAGNGHDGIRIGDRANVDVIANTCHRNRQSGIAFADMATGSIDANESAGNAGEDLYVSFSAAPKNVDARNVAKRMTQQNRPATQGVLGIAPLPDEQIWLAEKGSLMTGIFSSHDCRVIMTNRRLIIRDLQEPARSLTMTRQGARSMVRAELSTLEIKISGKKHTVIFYDRFVSEQINTLLAAD